MRRRRFMAWGAGAALVLAGCAGRDQALEREAARPGEGADDAQAPSGTGRDDNGRVPGGRDDGAPEASAPPAQEDAEPGGEGDPAQAVDPDAYPRSASEWGERVTGVRTRLATSERVMALTFDACGGPGSSGYDEALIDFLVDEEVPATLFVNQRWIEANADVFAALADNPLFEVANHGTAHVPLSVEGRSAYGIDGTASPRAVIDEVMGAQREIERRTGLRCAHFRPGTAYADEVAVRIVGDLGLEVVGFDVLGDAGATFGSGQVRDALLAASPGSVALLHMNHPGSGTAQGVMAAVPELREQGLSFATLGEHDLA